MNKVYNNIAIRSIKSRSFIKLLNIIMSYIPTEVRRRWEDNIRRDLNEIRINTRNWVDSAQDWDYWRAVVNAAWNLRVS